MSEASVMSPNNDILTTPKESLKTPKFREFNDITGGLAALRSPRDFKDFDSLNIDNSFKRIITIIERL